MRFGTLLSAVWICAVTAIDAEPAPAGGQTVFPLKTSRSGRYLVDQRGKAFLHQADTAWMLFLKLTEGEAEEYLRARKEQGFNAVQVMLTGFLGMTNRAGELPFDDNDLARPNEAFFAHVDRVVAKAHELGLQLAIAPLWSGCCGEGWAGRDDRGKLKPLNSNGADKARDFGEWLGRRYAQHPNIIWILGGDNDPDNARGEIRALAGGLKQAAPSHLLTYHAASSHSSTDVWPQRDWIDFPMIYTYFRGFNKAWNKEQPDVYEAGWREYAKVPPKPFFLGESTYEGEHGAWGSELQVRKQSYWAILSGAAGHAYGSVNWNIPDNWRTHLELPGAASLQHLREFFESIDWWRLVPEKVNQFAVNGSGTPGRNDLAVTAVSDDSTFAVTYLPSARKITFDLTRLSGSEFRVIWFNPRTGKRLLEGRMGKLSKLELEPPETGDWVLLVE